MIASTLDHLKYHIINKNNLYRYIIWPTIYPDHTGKKERKSKRYMSRFII